MTRSGTAPPRPRMAGISEAMPLLSRRPLLALSSGLRGTPAPSLQIRRPGRATFPAPSPSARALPMTTSAWEQRVVVPLTLRCKHHGCATRARPRPLGFQDGAHRRPEFGDAPARLLVIALTLVWCSSAHGTQICPATSMVLPRIRGGGDNFDLPCAGLNSAEKAIVESDAYIHWCLPRSRCVRRVPFRPLCPALCPSILRAGNLRHPSRKNKAGSVLPRSRAAQSRACWHTGWRTPGVGDSWNSSRSASRCEHRRSCSIRLFSGSCCQLQPPASHHHLRRGSLI